MHGRPRSSYERLECTAMGTGSIAHHHARRVEHKETKPGEAVNASRRASSESSRWKTQDWSTPIHNYQFQPVFFYDYSVAQQQQITRRHPGAYCPLLVSPYGRTLDIPSAIRHWSSRFEVPSPGKHPQTSGISRLQPDGISHLQPDALGGTRIV